MLYKCKVCRGTLSLLDNASIAQCEYCRTIQTVPVANDQKKLNKFQRAYDHIADGDFDSAILRFEDIIDEGYDEAEAYWGLLLCKFGMRYDNAPGTDDRILTCHRLSFSNVKDDTNFKEAIKRADNASKIIYQDEAEKIERIRQRAIELSNNEEPYDVFICYKDKDENGERTEDSVEAEKIYNELEKKGLKAFFARRTLSRKPGIEFEPYIFAALNSAKVMLVVGTSYDHFTAPWVKNEWSRFLTIKKKKQVWIYPCYKHISNPQRDLPREFQSLQSIDLSRTDAMQDLLKAIDGAVGNNTLSRGASAVTEASIRSRLNSISKRQTEQSSIVADPWFTTSSNVNGASRTPPATKTPSQPDHDSGRKRSFWTGCATFFLGWLIVGTIAYLIVAFVQIFF